jgi:ATP-binding cassette subfamily C (CFTR/MRP) protein 1
MLSVLLRLVDPLQGTVYVDGVDITRVPREIVRKRIICLPQEPFVVPGSVQFNLCPDGSIAGDRKISLDVMTAALQRVGLWQLVKDRGGLTAELDLESLSYGEQQLLALARAIIRKQANDGKCILVLDEATSNLDLNTESKVLRIINDEFQGNTIVSVAHRLESVQNADLIAVLEKGKILRTGRPQELFTNGYHDNGTSLEN